MTFNSKELEEAMNKFVAPDRKGKPRKPIDTVGDLVNLLNVARVATEEGVQKALRDVNNLLLPQDQRPERELLIGVQGWRKRMKAGEFATNRQITQMLGDQPTTPPRSFDNSLRNLGSVIMKTKMTLRCVNSDPIVSV